MGESKTGREGERERGSQENRRRAPHCRVGACLSRNRPTPAGSQGGATTHAAEMLAAFPTTSSSPSSYNNSLHPSPTRQSMSPLCVRKLARTKAQKTQARTNTKKKYNKINHLVRYPVWTGAAATAGSVLRPGLSVHPDVSVLGLHQEFSPNLSRFRLQNTKAKGACRRRPQPE